MVDFIAARLAAPHRSPDSDSRSTAPCPAAAQSPPLALVVPHPPRPSAARPSPSATAASGGASGAARRGPRTRCGCAAPHSCYRAASARSSWKLTLNSGSAARRSNRRSRHSPPLPSPRPSVRALRLRPALPDTWALGCCSRWVRTSRTPGCAAERTSHRPPSCRTGSNPSP